MKAIKAEYDSLFPVWKFRGNADNDETAAGTRSKFYTQNGWKGENYNSSLSLKEIAVLVREFIKVHYNDFKFSVTTSYASMCQELHIYLMEGPQPAYKTPEEWTKEQKSEYQHKEYIWKDHGYSEADLEKRRGEMFLNDYVCEAVKAVQDYAKSFNYSDCDGMIDYFDVNFYFFDVQIGKWDKPYKVVRRERKQATAQEYENVEVTKTRTKK